MSVHRNLLWQLSRDLKLHDSNMSYATTASLNPSFRAPWRVGDTVVSRENARWTTSKSGHPCPCQNCPQWPPAEKTGRESLLNRLSCPLKDTIGQGTELNYTVAFYLLVNLADNLNVGINMLDVDSKKNVNVAVDDVCSLCYLCLCVCALWLSTC